MEDNKIKWNKTSMFFLFLINEQVLFENSHGVIEKQSVQPVSSSLYMFAWVCLYVRRYFYVCICSYIHKLPGWTSELSLQLESLSQLPLLPSSSSSSKSTLVNDSTSVVPLLSAKNQTKLLFFCIPEFYLSVFNKETHRFVLSENWSGIVIVYFTWVLIEWMREWMNEESHCTNKEIVHLTAVWSDLVWSGLAWSSFIALGS